MKKSTLEDLFLKSAKDKLLYFQFISCLLESVIYLPVFKSNAQLSCMPVVWEDQLGKKRIPFFTSISALKKGCFITDPNNNFNYIEMMGSEFFLGLNNCDVVLNPNLEMTKEFTWKEIQSITKESSPWRFKVADDANILFFQPKKVPLISLDNLKVFFNDNKLIEVAIYSKISVIDCEFREYDLVGLKTFGSFGVQFKELELYLNNHKNEFENFKFVDLNQRNEIVNQLEKYDYFYN